MMSSGQGLSGEYLVRVNGSGDWLTAALGLSYGNEEHERRAEECEGQKKKKESKKGEARVQAAPAGRFTATDLLRR